MPLFKKGNPYILSAACCWVVYIMLSYWLVGHTDPTVHAHLLQDFEVQPFGINLFFTGFIVSIALFFKNYYNSDKPLNFNNDLWSTFYFSAGLLVVILLNTQFLHFFRISKTGDESLYNHSIDLLNNISIGLIILFVVNFVFSFKRMVLFQKNKITELSWLIFEGLLVLSLVFNFIHVPILHPVSLVSLGTFFLITFFLATRMPWVAYLSKTQKWKNVLYLVFTIIVLGLFVWYLYMEANEFHAAHRHQYIVLDGLQKPIVMNCIVFVGAYALSSIMVMLFNMPTASVFEQKFSEVFSFQKLSESIHTSTDLEEVYRTFLDLSAITTLAESAWLEVVDENNMAATFESQNITKDEVFKLKKIARKASHNIYQNISSLKNVKNAGVKVELANTKTRSLLLVPLFYKQKYMGLLGLTKNISHAFSNELIETIQGLTNQAAISISNSRLMVKAIETERYKEEISIARKVKQRLLPNISQEFKQLSLSVFSNSADEVGGDYYDCHYEDNKLRLILADVAGHGTAAAFNMAQLKGIFKALSQQKLGLKEFSLLMNNAILQCVDKKSFITLTLLEIDFSNNQVELLRAGHCPSLLHRDGESKLIDEHTKTLGMGMISSDKYTDFIEPTRFIAKSNDVLFLYTDGIIEARNDQNEFFEEKYLQEVVNKYAYLSAVEINQNIINYLHDFVSHSTIDDDYSSIIIKFK